LEKHHQKRLLQRLQSSGSRFHIDTITHQIDFSSQIGRIDRGGSFQQDIWGPLQRNGEISIFLSFMINTTAYETVSPGLSNPFGKYPISHCPIRISPAFPFSVPGNSQQ
jgi:hypothetical protein